MIIGGKGPWVQACPQLLRWICWSLNGPTILHLVERIIMCQTWVQQGDPLAPLQFSLGLHEAIEPSTQSTKLG